MEDYLTVKTGEEIFGTISMKPNAKNNVSDGLGGTSGDAYIWAHGGSHTPSPPPPGSEELDCGPVMVL